MGKQSQIALADMAYYWLCKQKITNAIECLEELRNELTKEDKFTKKNITNTNNKTNNSTFTWR